ncbi:hypothetical protein [Paenibacillus gorillae]|uniref:hypothetical protein n=1 Tax=Paenibacillus gorillae TaxID=1243662 RepID=UPI0004AE2EB8|nr:hypothetical protein [Paenibacillus gorillae]
MTEPSLRDKLSKVMAERSANAEPLPEPLPETELPLSRQDEANAEWKAFYAAVRAQMLKMRE